VTGAGRAAGWGRQGEPMSESTDPDSSLFATASAQGGYVTRGQLAAAGFTRQTIDAFIRAGVLDHRAFDLFAVFDMQAADAWQDRVRRAAVETGPQAMVARETAARWHGLSGAPVIAPITLTLPLKCRDPKLPGVSVKRSDVPVDDRDEVDGLRLTSPLRTVLDCGRFGDRVTAICLIESAVREEKVTVAEVIARADAMVRTPGVRALREALALVDLRSESPLETVVRIALLDAGLPYPELQLPFSYDQVNGRIDLAYPAELLGARCGRYVGLAIEADGREPHLQEDTFHHDRVRQTALEEHDWLVRRFTDRAARRSPSYVVQTTRRAMDRVIAG
jgi:hypothetical protein